jgi:hypothetical protein
MNSRKSLCKGIGVESLAEQKENFGALFRGHAGAFLEIGCLSVLEAIKDAHDRFHSFYFTAWREASLMELP